MLYVKRDTYGNLLQVEAAPFEVQVTEHRLPRLRQPEAHMRDHSPSSQPHAARQARSVVRLRGWRMLHPSARRRHPLERRSGQTPRCSGQGLSG